MNDMKTLPSILTNFYSINFFITAILVNKKWYTMVDLICIFLNANDMEHLMDFINQSCILFSEIAAQIFLSFLN